MENDVTHKAGACDEKNSTRKPYVSCNRSVHVWNGVWDRHRGGSGRECSADFISPWFLVTDGYRITPCRVVQVHLINPSLADNQKNSLWVAHKQFISLDCVDTDEFLSEYNSQMIIWIWCTIDRPISYMQNVKSAALMIFRVPQVPIIGISGAVFVRPSGHSEFQQVCHLVSKPKAARCKTSVQQR